MHFAQVLNLTMFKLMVVLFLNQATEEDSPFDISDSELSEDANTSEDETNTSDQSDSDAEHWDDLPMEEFTKNIPAATPLPEPERRKSRVQQVNSLVFWLVYFLLVWQASCKISENGLVWLLQFLFQFLKVLGMSISNDFLAELINLLPTSLYLLRQFINFDRDSFTKYVVCPKCTKIYGYDSCLKVENNRTVAKRCSNTFMSRGQKKNLQCPVG